MTEKRFKETVSTGIVTDTLTGKEYKCEMRIDEDLLKFLNELHEENRELQRHLDVMRSGALTDDKRIKELYEKNERLKQEKQLLYEYIDFLKKFIEKQEFKVKLDSDAGCKDYGLNCLKCSYWNKWSQYCTKRKIWIESHD